MNLIQKFMDNTISSVRKPFLTGLATCSMLGGVATTQQAKAQSIEAKYYFGYSQVSSDMIDKKAFNPYEEGSVLTIGGEIALADEDSALGNIFGLKGEYRYHLADPNQFSYHHNTQIGGQQQHVSYSHVPSRAMLALTANTPAQYKLQAQAYGGLLAYPGNEVNWANSSHFVAGAELRYDIFNKKSAVNLQAFARAEYISYNKEFLNAYFLPEDLTNSTTVNAGIRLTYKPR